MPNSKQTNPQLKTQRITANGQSVAVQIEGYSAIGFQMVATSLVGHNATFEVSMNAVGDAATGEWDGTSGDWFPIIADRTNANSYTATETTTGTLAATPTYGWIVNCGPWKFFRIRATAHTSGTATYTIRPGYESCAVKPATSVNLGGGAAAAHDVAVSGNPVRTAGRALTSNYAAVSTGDTADYVTTLVGAQITKPYSIPEGDWQFACATGGIVNTTDVVAKAAGAAGIRNYVTGIQLRNANTVATEFVIKDGSTVIWRGYVSATATEAPISVTFATPLRGTAATAINIACITTAAQVYASLQGFQAP